MSAWRCRSREARPARPVVAALEVDPVVDQHRPLVEQVLEHVLGGGPVPPAPPGGPSGSRKAEAGSGPRPGSGPAPARRGAGGAGGCRPTSPGVEAASRRIRAVHSREAGHGQERGGVAPVPKPYGARRRPGRRRPGRRRPGRPGPAVAAGDHVDGVDLDGAEPSQGGAQGGRAWPGGPGPGRQPRAARATCRAWSRERASGMGRNLPGCQDRS